MIDNDLKRLSRLTAILIQLQTKRLVTATSLAEKFEVSVRTIYRDIKALEQAGVPILTEEGKGYSIMEGYRLPPVMFTETEANALITAEQFIIKDKDASFVKEYTAAINKIRSVLPHHTKDKVDLLSSRVIYWNNYEEVKTSKYLSQLQLALTNYNLTKITYQISENEERTTRTIQPFALYNSSQENWLVLAYCDLRKDYRAFRLDRILQLELLPEKFEQHKMTLQKYFEEAKEKHPKNTGNK
ncbi:HTH domain-containing protein [Chitinophaga sp. SYP-B3965]|uniref:helix-turn-helix transcriptional regulator n=1 Tax=Chitinophaga sp. SYP-B3965 TaxID=2663120 RepID=UPI001299FF03|nr:YafY family protein [Chitinophaga sp. SYP-B3965]MRG45771.1 HTH domain-containing protein [Chitinophaga sp. SYP-B3965]